MTNDEPRMTTDTMSRLHGTAAGIQYWGAQAASLWLPAACRQRFREAISCERKGISAGCRDEQAGSLCSPERDTRHAAFG